MSNIIFGTIKVRSSNKIHTVKRAVWKEGDTTYRPHKNIFKELAYINKVIESKQVGQTNY
jgi:hypothetical protein